MFKHKISKGILTVIAALAAACGLSTLVVGSASATTEVATHTTSSVKVLAPPTSNRCVNATHTISCWATTLRPATLYLRNGGTVSLGGNDLVLIDCYYEVGTTVYDHVTEENGGSLQDTGHINDANINLDNHNPWALPSPPNIPLCG